MTIQSQQPVVRVFTITKEQAEFIADLASAKQIPESDLVQYMITLYMEIHDAFENAGNVRVTLGKRESPMTAQDAILDQWDETSAGDPGM